MRSETGQHVTRSLEIIDLNCGPWQSEHLSLPLSMTLNQVKPSMLCEAATHSLLGEDHARSIFCGGTVAQQ